MTPQEETDPIIAQINELIQQTGYPPHELENRDGQIWHRQVVGGNYVTGYIQKWMELGPSEEVLHQAEAIARGNPPLLEECPRCRTYSSTMSGHDCRYLFTGWVQEAAHQGDREQVEQIVAEARRQGVELLGNWWKK